MTAAVGAEATSSIGTDHGDGEEWVRGFRLQRGRAPRVLHIGNIANNAYLLAKALNAIGVESDVLSENNYHIMASPEWEDADFDATVLDQDRPDWSRIDLGGFSRPRWFAQGPLAACASYLEARRQGRHLAASAWWAALTVKRYVSCASLLANVRTAYQTRRAHPGTDAAPFDSPGPYAPVVERFSARFPDRADGLRQSDVGESAARASTVASLMRAYDVVHAYATEPILPMLAGRHPYVAFEHGTIRDIPFQPNAVGRLTALAYREADEVIITNADNRVAAERLGLPRYRFVPHPVNEQAPDVGAAASLRRGLREELSADFLVFHPSRQHWNPDLRDPSLEKGNDIFIRGFARFVRRPGVRAGAVFVNWGRHVDDSKRLLAECGVADRVRWIPPQPRVRMVRFIEATDVVADQFILGAFGSITPQALHSGRPVLLRLDDDRHRWCFPEMPPVLNASTPEDVEAHLTQVYTDRSYAARLVAAGTAWYDRYHAMPLVTSAILGVYRDALAVEHGR